MRLRPLPLPHPVYLPLGMPSILITAAVPGAWIEGVGPERLSLRFCFGVGTYTVQYTSTPGDCWKVSCKEAGLMARMWGRHRNSSHGDRFQAHGSGSHTCEGFEYRIYYLLTVIITISLRRMSYPGSRREMIVESLERYVYEVAIKDP